MKKIVLALSITFAIFSNFGVGIASAHEANTGLLKPNVLFACEGNTKCMKNCAAKLWWSPILLAACL